MKENWSFRYQSVRKYFGNYLTRARFSKKFIDALMTGKIVGRLTESEPYYEDIKALLKDTEYLKSQRRTQLKLAKQNSNNEIMRKNIDVEMVILDGKEIPDVICLNCKHYLYALSIDHGLCEVYTPNIAYQKKIKAEKGYFMRAEKLESKRLHQCVSYEPKNNNYL